MAFTLGKKKLVKAIDISGEVVVVSSAFMNISILPKEKAIYRLNLKRSLQSLMLGTPLIYY